MLGAVGAAGAAYLATTDGEKGDAARGAGAATNKAMGRVKELNDEHDFTTKVRLLRGRQRAFSDFKPLTTSCFFHSHRSSHVHLHACKESLIRTPTRTIMECRYNQRRSRKGEDAMFGV